MKTAVNFGLIFILLLVAACVPFAQKPDGVFTPTEPLAKEETALPTVEMGLTEQKLQNMSYLSPSFEINAKLTNGVFIEDTMTITLLPQIAIGDLNGDLVDDAAVLLAENGGGTGNFVSLVVIVSEDGNLDQVGQVLIDDRPLIESVSIVDGMIKLSAVIHGINDAMALPTVKVNQTYSLLENNLTLMRQVSAVEGGTERMIIIDDPQSGSEVSDTFSIKGSMAVAPFENSLSLMVLNQAGMELYTDGFMVTSADLGGPATFDNEITLPAMPGGTWVRLELAELSMADGSVVSMDSVLVKIK